MARSVGFEVNSKVSDRRGEYGKCYKRRVKATGISGKEVSSNIVGVCRVRGVGPRLKTY